MPISKKILLVFIVTLIGDSTGEECQETRSLLSKCYDNEKYQWLVQVPKGQKSCKGIPVPEPKSVPCGFTCPKGATFDQEALGCRKCPKGSFSLGGGEQYTFSSLDNIDLLPREFSLKAKSAYDGLDDKCKKSDFWKIKDNALQGDVQSYCTLSLAFRFKLSRPGSITITYSLPTSFVIGALTSRCAFTADNADNDDEDGPRKELIFVLGSTNYGTWKEKKVKIDDEGDYELVLLTEGLTSFHFPFSIQSIIVEGSTGVQDCIPCPPGTHASEEGSVTCKPCAENFYASTEGSSKCKACDKDSEYSEEGATKCLQRPVCEEKHYRKVFTGCDTSDTAVVKYEPIEPKICINGGPPSEKVTMPCGTCNPGMYKEKNICQFCPEQTFSNGTLSACLPCEKDRSLLSGLYYKNWNELPIYLNRSYMSFDNPEYLSTRTHQHSWIPSITYISAQALPDTLSVLSLQINKGFRQSEIAKATKEYGTLYFKFSTQCKSTCSLFLVSQDPFNDDDNQNWEVVSKWTIDQQYNHKNATEYIYSIQHPDAIIFIWMFQSDGEEEGVDEVRIHEIRVTNTVLGGSDRCVSCLTANNQETKCQFCSPGHILSNTTCVPCPPSSIASRVRLHDPVPTICTPCPNNTLSDDGISCYVPCTQAFNGSIEYNLTAIPRIQFHGPKLFTQKGSGYFHVFNASICGKSSVTCSKTPSSTESKRTASQMTIESKLCRMGSVPDKTENLTSVAYIDDFGEQLSSVSLLTLDKFPLLRSDYNLPDITLTYRANISASESPCSERITHLSLRCDHTLEETNTTSGFKYRLQTPSDCVTGNCDGCKFYYLLRTPLACPTCDENTNGYRIFVGPCKFGRQEVRKIPYTYCAQNLTEKFETHRCSILSVEIEIVLALFLVIAGALIWTVIFCWRKNRKLEYRYMQLVENANPDDDTPVDNVCAQLSDEDDSGEEIQFQTQSKAKKIMNVVRNAIRKNPKNGRSDAFNGDSFLLTNTSNDA